MGKVLFAYNGRIEKDADGNYFGNELNDTIVERYRQLANEVIFLVRVKPLSNESAGRVRPFRHAHFSVCELDNFSGLGSYLKNFSNRKKVIEDAVRNADVVVGRLPSSVGRLAISSAVKLNKPYLVEVVGCPWDALWNHSLIGKLVAPVAYIKMKMQVSRAPFVLYVTQRFLQKRYPNRHFNVGVSDVIINEADDNILNERKKRIEDYSPKEILSIGTIAGIDVKYKGQADVLRAIVQLKKSNLQIKYYIIGKGTGEYLQKLVAEYGLQNEVEVVGQVPHDRVGEYIRMFDIYLQPSKMEGLPRAVVEALSYGCPCIGSNAGGIPELLSKEMIYPKGNIGELSNLLKKITRDVLHAESAKNFSTSKLFLPQVLDSRRAAFFSSFIKTIPN